MYSYGSIGILYTSIQFSVLAVARYWLYRDRLRVSEKSVYGIVAALCLASALLWIVAGGIPGMNYDMYRLLFSAFMFVLSCVIIKAPFVEHVFSYAFILAFTSSAETTAFYIQLNFIPNAPDYAYPAISAAIIAAAFVPGVRCLARMIKRLGEMGSDSIWGWLDLACYSFLLMNLLVTLPHPVDMKLYYPIGRYLMLLGMTGIYRASVRMMDLMRTAADARAELSLTQRRVFMQQNYYDRMVAQMDEVRRIRHDLRHHHAVIAALIQSGDVSALSAYLDDCPVPGDALPVTGSLVANSILLFYLDEAKALGVRMETELILGREIVLTDADLCVILGNLLENAVDAQRYLAPEQRYIRITAKGDAQSLTLAVDNRFDGTLKHDENGAYLSRKKGEGHGLGLSSVRVVCEKYGGILQLETEDDMFMAGVVIGV